MDISVLVPVYNVEKYIRRCLQSIANQTLTNSVECIIINDCGNDNSIALANDFIHNYEGNIVFKIIHHSNNKGLATARNTALKHCNGKYILHIDSDDYCEPTMLEDYMRVARETDADIVISDFWYTYEDHEEYCKQYLSSSKSDIINDMLSHRLFTVNWNKFIKKSLYSDYNIKYNDGANYGEDISVCFPLMLSATKIEHIDKAYVHYVQYNSSAYNYVLSKKSYQDYILNLSLVHETIRESGYYDSCKVTLLEKELTLMLELLLHSRGELQRKWCEAFPETKNYVFSSKMNFIKKVAIWLAFRQCFFPISILRRIISFRSGKEIVVYS